MNKIGKTVIQFIAIFVLLTCTSIEVAHGQSNAADIVIAVDNSGSMEEEASFVQLNLNTFVNQLVLAGIDAHLVLISADICVPAPTGSGLCPDDTNLPRYMHIHQTVGSNNALNMIIDNYPSWTSQMRADASKHLVVVSDDDSGMSAVDFNTAFLGLDASHGGYQFHAIASPENPISACLGQTVCCPDYVPLCAALGQQYIDLATLTEGVFHNLCLQDFSPFFNDVVTAIIQSFPGQGIKINEVFPNPVGSDSGYEWVELYNNGANAVDISGWQIQSATSSWSTVFTLPDSTSIEPGTFLVIGDDLVEIADFNLPSGSSLYLGNASTSGDAIRIVDADSTIIDTVVYGDNNTDMFLDDTGEIASSLAPIGAAGESIARNVDGLDTDASGNDFSVYDPTPGSTNIVAPVTCNTNIVSDVTEYGNVTYEACEILSLGPSFIAANGSSVTVNSGWEIDFLPGFLIEQGATLDANVCGQSLCLTSSSPMPYGCHSCVDQICDIDSFCCTDMFDDLCLNMVDTVCGLVCE